MDVLSLALLAIVAFAALLQGLSGFAFPMLMTMLLTMFMPFQTAVAWTILPSLLLNGVSLLQGVDVRTLVRRYAVFAGLATLGSLLGVYVLRWVEALGLQLWWAVVMIWYVGRAWLKPAQRHPPPMPQWQMNSLGFLAGVVGSATNAMAPILMIALLAMNKGRRETIQVANLCFILSKLCQFVGLYVGGQWLFTWQDADMLVAVCVVALLLWFVGHKWQQRLSPVLFQKVVLLMLAAMAVLQLWQALPLLWLKLHA